MSVARGKSQTNISPLYLFLQKKAIICIISLKCILIIFLRIDTVFTISYMFFFDRIFYHAFIGIQACLSTLELEEYDLSELS